MAVPPPRYHTVKYAGVLAPASPLRSRIAPVPPRRPASQVDERDAPVPERRSNYRPWAELLRRTFGIDVLQCPTCKGRMKLVAMVTKQKALGEVA
jgi:hypothetical protein